MKVKISACQFEVKKINSFKEFKQQVLKLMENVPRDAHYVLFPELLTIGLFDTFDTISIEQLSKIDKFTKEFHRFFKGLAIERQQVIIAGSHLEQVNDKIYNVCTIFNVDGCTGQHKKTHIFPAESTWQTAEGHTLEIYEFGPVKIGIAICYEVEIPEVSRILSIKGADIIFCPSFTFTEAGFWRVRHCAQARAIENQLYVVHCPTVGQPGGCLPPGNGAASIISPCDLNWPANGLIAEAPYNQEAVVTGIIDIDELYENRKNGAATTFKDRTRRESVYKQYAPYNQL